MKVLISSSVIIYDNKNRVLLAQRSSNKKIVGFRCPVYVEGINVPGYHLHFITKDKKAGGHLLECQIKNVKIEIDYTSEFYMALLESNEFYKVDLAKEKQTELNKVEK